MIQLYDKQFQNFEPWSQLITVENDYKPGKNEKTKPTSKHFQTFRFLSKISNPKITNPPKNEMNSVVEKIQEKIDQKIVLDLIY